MRPGIPVIMPSAFSPPFPSSSGLLRPPPFKTFIFTFFIPPSQASPSYHLFCFLIVTHTLTRSVSFHPHIKLTTRLPLFMMPPPLSMYTVLYSFLYRQWLFS